MGSSGRSSTYSSGRSSSRGRQSSTRRSPRSSERSSNTSRSPSPKRSLSHAQSAKPLRQDASWGLALEEAVAFQALDCDDSDVETASRRRHRRSDHNAIAAKHNARMEEARQAGERRKSLM